MRELRPDDAPFVHALMNEPSFIAQIGDRNVRTIEDAQRYIERGPWTEYSRRGFGLWLVELRDSRQPIGVCGLLQRDALPSPDIGFAFRADFWAQGYATESARAVMNFAAAALHLSEILAVVSPGNTASIRVLEKLGFTPRRQTDESRHPHGVALYAARL
jgi:RimJ/RimL family protein N-acetyltransferase